MIYNRMTTAHFQMVGNRPIGIFSMQSVEYERCRLTTCEKRHRRRHLAVLGECAALDD